jgi:hypothetical protein
MGGELVNAFLEVLLDYKLVGHANWKRLPLTIEEYFDPKYVSNDEEADIDDVPLHDHAIEYLGLDRSLVENTRLTVVNNRDGKKRIIVETFWHGGANRIIERTDQYNGKEDYWELILDSQLPSICHARTTEIMRISRKEGILGLLSHVFITAGIDESESELQLYPRDVQ